MVPGVQAKEKYKGTFIYIPLDDRPVTYSYPVKNLQAAGYEILTPPEKYLASADRTGDPDRLWQWLVENAPDADAAVISSDGRCGSNIFGRAYLRRAGCQPHAFF